MERKILAVIPARGGSKGLKRKNIIELKGKPLIAWTIESSLQSKYITKTIVSSEDDEILNISEKYGANTIKRPPELATDEANSESVVLHVLDVLQKKNEIYDYVILLQPTSPLRNAVDIDNAFERLFQFKATALISVQECDNKILKAFVKDDEYIKGVSNNKYPFMRRQDLPPTYLSNGAIYIIKQEEFIKNKSFFTDKTVSYLMNKIKSLDIDTKDDLEEVRKYI